VSLVVSELCTMACEGIKMAGSIQANSGMPPSSNVLDGLRFDLALGQIKNWDHLQGSPSFITYLVSNAA